MSCIHVYFLFPQGKHRIKVERNNPPSRKCGRPGGCTLLVQGDLKQHLGLPLRQPVPPHPASLPPSLLPVLRVGSLRIRATPGTSATPWGSLPPEMPDTLLPPTPSQYGGSGEGAASTPWHVDLPSVPTAMAALSAQSARRGTQPTH